MQDVSFHFDIFSARKYLKFKELPVSLLSRKGIWFLHFYKNNVKKSKIRRKSNIKNS